MLAPEERGLVPANSPVEIIRGAPPPLGRHFSQQLDLLRAGLFVRQHNHTMLDSGEAGKRQGYRRRFERGSPAPEMFTPSQIFEMTLA
jgi:hypothetical protein